MAGRIVPPGLLPFRSTDERGLCGVKVISPFLLKTARGTRAGQIDQFEMSQISFCQFQAFNNLFQTKMNFAHWIFGADIKDVARGDLKPEPFPTANGRNRKLKCKRSLSCPSIAAKHCYFICRNEPFYKPTARQGCRRQ